MKSTSFSSLLCQDAVSTECDIYIYIYMPTSVRTKDNMAEIWIMYLNDASV